MMTTYLLLVVGGLLLHALLRLGQARLQAGHLLLGLPAT